MSNHPNDSYEAEEETTVKTLTRTATVEELFGDKGTTGMAQRDRVGLIANSDPTRR